ncbi:MAG TPA: 4Fe-4S dicluster domain-containing protein [Thermoprotei archaeon]|nr:4Fe-4S binding protein [Euryarchaeota archaeon]MCD6158107.1 4Fe-4S binding protein [Euryarchaeota archaeon]HDJ51138.1 4Fe-4S dicluster domain-containing protein [Thermoprotei archaeon]
MGGKRARVLKVVNMERCIGCEMCVMACSNIRVGMLTPEVSAVRVKSTGGLEGAAFSVIVCRSCYDPPCAKVCPTDALTPADPRGIFYNEKKCIGCGNCVSACPYRAIYISPITEKAVVCIQCGICTNFCPHNILQMVPVE